MKRMSAVTSAMVTPFDRQGGIDWGCLKEHIDFLISSGVNGIYPAGTGGEPISMTCDERKRLTEKVVEFVDGRVDVFVHVGTLKAAETIDLALHAKSAGADGVGAVTPYFYQLSQQELFDYYAELSRGIPEDFPIYLYNLPTFTRNDLLPQTVRRLAELPNIVGIKNTMADAVRLCELIRTLPEDFDVIVGDDTVILAGLALGAKGIISSPSNIAPEFYVSLCKCFAAEDLAGARKAQQMINALIFDVMQGKVAHYVIKAAMRARGMRQCYARPPVSPGCGEDEYARIVDAMQALMKDSLTVTQK